MDGWIALGKVTRAHGIQGRIKVRPYNQDSENLPHLKDISLKMPGGESRPFRVLSSAASNQTYILELSGVTTRNAAEELVGAEILVKRDALAPLDEDSYYITDLFGMDVVTDDGDLLGTLVDVMETGANDVFVVRESKTKKEILLPDIPDVILDIVWEEKRVLVHLLPGLLDDDDAV